MIVDKDSNVIYKKNGGIRSLKYDMIEILNKIALDDETSYSTYHGTGYSKKTCGNNCVDKRIVESNPCLLKAGEEGLIYSYSTDKNGTMELRLKLADKDINASEGYNDAYCGVSTIGPDGKIWTFFCALAESNKYDIFARSFDADGHGGEALNLTKSTGDAMYPSATTDENGVVWISYYRWRKMGAYSRDKEIYARCFNDNKWSPEFRISPKDVPDYEDHTDPSITPLPGGGVACAWSWDLHTMKDKKYKRYHDLYNAEAPTIFGRTITKDKGAEDLLFFGARSFDAAPELFTAKDKSIWCAWNALNFQHSKYLMASITPLGETDRAEQFVIEEGAQDICSPRFAEYSGELVCVFASQDFENRWRLKFSSFSKGDWSAPKVLENEIYSKDLSLAKDKKGELFAAIVCDEKMGRKIIVKKLTLK